MCRSGSKDICTLQHRFLCFLLFLYFNFYSPSCNFTHVCYFNSLSVFPQILCPFHLSFWSLKIVCSFVFNNLNFCFKKTTSIVADSYISAITRVLLYPWIWKFRQRRSFVHRMLSATHTWAGISNSYLPISNYVTTASKVYCWGCSFYRETRSGTVQQRLKQGEVGPSVRCIRIRGKRTFGKKLLKCSVDWI